MKTYSRVVIAAATLLALAPETSFGAKVEELVVGPVVEQQGLPFFPYTPSPRGAHLGTANRKGSRFAVTVDGVEGPRFDEIFSPNWPAVDMRKMTAGTPPPVVFSRDGKRHAYVGRQGDQWVVMVDGKEALKLPPEQRNSTSIAMEFSGEDGKRFLFSRSKFEGSELWVDGQKWPGTYQSNTSETSPVISPDGKIVACVMMLSREKSTLIINGKDMGFAPAIGKFWFTPDSQHFVTIAPSPKGDTLIMDGKALGTSRGIDTVYISPVGNRIAAVISHMGPNGMQDGYVLLVDGKPVPATHGANTPKPVIFSPDGKHWAALCGKAGAQFVVIDGKKGQEYQSISDIREAQSGRPWLEGGSQFFFTGDSSKMVYVANQGGKSFVVVNEDESDGLNFLAGLRNSADGKHLAYWEGSGNPAKLFVDGKVVAKTPRAFNQFKFNPDGSRYAYQSHLDDGGTYLDGQKTGLVCMIANDTYEYVFSPDGQHLAFMGTRPTDIKQGIWVDRELITPGQNSRFCAFTPDSQHVYWVVSEHLGGGKHQYIVHLDGKPVARFDAFTTFDRVYNYPIIGRLSTPPAGWDLTDDGVLNVIGPVGDEIKRFTITPTAETSLATMFADAKAGGGKTKATK